MNKKYKIATLIFTFLALISINIWAVVNTLDDVSVNYNGIYGAFVGTLSDGTSPEVTGYGPNTISLPIEEYYTPTNASITPTFIVKSESYDKVKISDYTGSMSYSSPYETKFYELGEEEESEHFFLSYSGYNKGSKKYDIAIYYLPQFYSNLSGYRDKKTNIDIDLNINWIYKSSNGEIHSFRRTVDNKKSSLTNPYNTEDHYYYSEFNIHLANKYQNISNILEFYFTWDKTTLQAVNDYSQSHNNGYQFVGREPVYSNVIFSVTAN